MELSSLGSNEPGASMAHSQNTFVDLPIEPKDAITAISEASNSYTNAEPVHIDTTGISSAALPEVVDRNESL